MYQSLIELIFDKQSEMIRDMESKYQSLIELIFDISWLENDSGQIQYQSLIELIFDGRLYLSTVYLLLRINLL